MRAVLPRVVTLMATVAFSGCGGEAPVEPPVSAPQVEIGGIWDFTEVLIISERLEVCSDTGSFNFTQNGSTFTATGNLVGSCVGPTDSSTSGGAFTISGGIIDGSTLSFRIDDGCVYRGTVIDGPPRRIEGSSGCSINLDGSWEAVPAKPAESLNLILDSASVVVGQTVVPSVVVHDTRGARIFERPIDWTSSAPGVAAVGQGGIIVMIDAGTATVTASLPGLSDSIHLTASFVNFVAVDAGFYHTCAIGTDGTPYCWGVNDVGQAGPDPRLAPCAEFPCVWAPSPVPGTPALTAISGGFQNTCGLSTAGGAYCWGINWAGQLGIDIQTASSRTAVAVSGGPSFDKISVGTNHVCGIAAQASAYCWGLNSRGQLGSSVTFSTDPIAVAGGLEFATVTPGEEHTCALGIDGATYCWGFNFFGQLGIDSVTETDAPRPVRQSLDYTMVSTGRHYNCGLLGDGTAHCWGNNLSRQLGVDSVEVLSIDPVPVSGGFTFVTIDPGPQHACGITDEGAAYCWGRNVEGQLGTGFTSALSATPLAVAGDLVFVTITGGSEHTCGLTVDGVIYCWGSNDFGQLGNAAMANSLVPTRVVGQL